MYCIAAGTGTGTGTVSYRTLWIPYYLINDPGDEKRESDTGTASAANPVLILSEVQAKISCPKIQ
jgi:hypothetical protein